jgi:biotin carboxyl carrier protein
MRYRAMIGGSGVDIELRRRGPGRYEVRLDGDELAVETRRQGDALLLGYGGRTVETFVEARRSGAGAPHERQFAVSIGPRTYSILLGDALRRGGTAPGASLPGRLQVRSVMPGRIGSLLVREGDEVRAGQGLLVVEAMKMENEIPSPKDGRVVAIRVRPGQTVEPGTLLVEVE